MALSGMQAHPFLALWRSLLNERVDQGVGALAQTPGVRGLILAGSVGRREAWPLSDIDVIPIYADEHAERTAELVKTVRLLLLDTWSAEGYGTALDIGRLAFRQEEVARALATPPPMATQYLDDPRWFHSLDKAYHGRAVFDGGGQATALAHWFTTARVAPSVVRGRQEIHWQQTGVQYDQAVRAVQAGELLRAAIAIRESLHALTRYLIEYWGGRDNSFARFGTRFERTAAERSERELAAEIMALYGLAPDEVVRRMAVAPHGLQYRHRWRWLRQDGTGAVVVCDLTSRCKGVVEGRAQRQRASGGQPPTRLRCAQSCVAEWVALPMLPPRQRGIVVASAIRREHAIARSGPPWLPWPPWRRARRADLRRSPPLRC